jgi:hypothetical protein
VVFAVDDYEEYVAIQSEAAQAMLVRQQAGQVVAARTRIVEGAIATWAADDLRSVNAQIEYALRLALKQVGREQKAGKEPRTEE